MLSRSICAVMALVLAAPASAMQSAAPLEPPAAPQSLSTSLPPPVVTQGAIISNPDWERLPNGGDLASLYPPAARKRREGGHVNMQCRVRADGSLDACVILEECPMGEGFGAATLRAAPYFRMRPRTVDGAPVDGGRVIIPLRWQVAGGPPGPHSCGAARPVTPVALPPPMPLPTPAAEATPQAVAGPNWVRTPTGDDLSRIYPGRARDRRLGGHTTMACKVRKDGTLTDCAITEETPTGYGFGEAALASAQYFRMSPTTADGKSVEGGTVVIPIGWRMAP